MGKSLASVLLIAALTLGRFASALTPATMPSADDLHKLFDDKQYQPVLQNLARVLQLKGTAAQGYDRVDLLMLRGEALIQLKQQAAAVEAFDSAAKEATAPQKDVVRKPEQIAQARAMKVLVHHSPSLRYTPRIVAAGQKPEPILLADVPQRPAAFRALLADTLAEMGPKAKAASHGTSLPPIIDIIRQLGDLRALEAIVTKATKSSDEMLAAVGDQAFKLMDKEIDRLAPAEEKISKLAHQQQQHVLNQRTRDSAGVITINPVSTTTTYRGLFSVDQQNLKQIVSTCEQVISASHDFADITSGTLATDFGKLSIKAQKLGEAAVATLNDDYTSKTVAAP